MKNCPQCRAENEAADQFCRSCGAPLAQAQQAPPQPMQQGGQPGFAPGAPQPMQQGGHPGFAPGAPQPMQQGGQPGFAPGTPPPMQQGGQPGFAPGAPQPMPQGGQPGFPQNPGYPPPGVPQPFFQPKTNKAPLVLGIVGAVFALLFPLVTYCTAIPGLAIYLNERGKGRPVHVAPLVVNIVALAVAAVNSIAGIIQYLT